MYDNVLLLLFSFVPTTSMLRVCFSPRRCTGGSADRFAAANSVRKLACYVAYRAGTPSQCTQLHGLRWGAHSYLIL